MQVVHFDTAARARRRSPGCAAPTASCRRDIAVQWAQPVPDALPLRAPARSARRYAYVLLESPVRPSAGGRPRGLGRSARSTATRCAQRRRMLVGEHDFSSFRASACQAPSPVKTLRRDRDHAARRLLALRLRGRRLPAPHDPQHHGLPGARRPAASEPPEWMREVLAGAQPRSSRRRPSRPTASTSWARTTTPAGAAARGTLSDGAAYDGSP